MCYANSMEKERSRKAAAPLYIQKEGKGVKDERFKIVSISGVDCYEKDGTAYRNWRMWREG